jgi:hypothetical protein
VTTQNDDESKEMKDQMNQCEAMMVGGRKWLIKGVVMKMTN